MYLSHIDVSLPLFFSPFPFLKQTNKISGKREKKNYPLKLLQTLGDLYLQGPGEYMGLDPEDAGSRRAGHTAEYRKAN